MLYNPLMQHLIHSTLLSQDVLSSCFTTRLDGVSKRPYQSNNLAFHVGDNKEDVLLNHQHLAKSMGYDHQRVVHMRQIHSDKVIIVDPLLHDFENPPECDALITDQTNIPLMVMTADCTPVLFFDPVNRVIAVAHAGRAGALQGIVSKTIEKMSKHFGTHTEELLIVLGPSIGPCCYEVGETIAQEVTESGYAHAVVHKEGSYMLDVNAIIHRQLQEAGVVKTHIDDLSICNACHHDTYFSYRADHQRTGRFCGVIMLNKSENTLSDNTLH